MTKTTFPYNSYLQSCDPGTAAMLSILPGLGQLYNGEKRKGLLFLEVAAINYFLLTLVIFMPPLLDGLKSCSAALNLKPNIMLLAALRQAHWGSPFSIILLGMVMMFIAYAVRDAYDRAANIRRRKIYPAHVIELTEAASGSYLLHLAVMITCCILGLFFLVPKPPVAQIMEIQFVAEQTPAKKPIESNLVSSRDSIDAGQHRSKDRAGAQRQPERVHSPQPRTSPAKSEPIKQQMNVPASAPAQRSLPVAKPMQLPRIASNMPVPRVPVLEGHAAPAAPPAPGVQQPRRVNMAPALVPSPTVSPNRPVVVPSLTALSEPVKHTGAMPSPVAFKPLLATGPVPLPERHEQGSGLPGAPALQKLASATPVAVLVVSPRSGMTGANGAIGSGPPTMVPVATGHDVGPAGNPSPVLRNSSGGGTKGMSDRYQPTPLRMGGSSGTGIGKSNGTVLAVNPVGTSDTGGSQGKIGSPTVDTRKEYSERARQEPNWGPYMDYLQQRIKHSWFPPTGMQSKRVIVMFKVHSDGTLSHLVLHKTCGSSLADLAALKAVETAAPFRQLPEGADEDADIQFTFDYNVFGGGHGEFRRF